MVTRREDVDQFTHTYDFENRIQIIKKFISGVSTEIGRFYYDADGAAVKWKGTDGAITVTVGPHYEKNNTTGISTSYYFFGGQRVAMRKNGAMFWLHGDQLGSTSLTTNITGTAIGGTMRYKPFGEPRNGGAIPTDLRFTGQRELGRVGQGMGSLMFYGARAYSPVLGRFVSADTVVPGAGNPQALNRYSYGFNNPLGFRDPTGHDPRDDNGHSMNDNCNYAGYCRALPPKSLPQLPGKIWQGIKNTYNAIRTLPATLDALLPDAAGLHIEGGSTQLPAIFSSQSAGKLSKPPGLLGVTVPATDLIYNFKSGEFSAFWSPSVSFIAGKSSSVAVSVQLVNNLPKNEGYQGVFENQGAQVPSVLAPLSITGGSARSGDTTVALAGIANPGSANLNGGWSYSVEIVNISPANGTVFVPSGQQQWNKFLSLFGQ